MRLVGRVHEETRKWSKTLGGQWVIHWRDTCTYNGPKAIERKLRRCAYIQDTSSAPMSGSA